MTMSLFIKMIQNREVEELQRKTFAWSLISLIARRACRETRTALVGDWAAYGMTKGQYRRAKKILSDGRYCSFVGTNKGTVARLLDDRIFDINVIKDSDTLATPKATPTATLEATPQNELENGNYYMQNDTQRNTHSNPITTPNNNKELNNKYIYNTPARKFMKKYFSPEVIDALQDYTDNFFQTHHRVLLPIRFLITLKHLKEIPEKDRLRSVENSTGKWDDFYPVNIDKKMINKKDKNTNKWGASDRNNRVFRNNDQNYKQIKQVGGY
jgi:hypothetical protein